MTDPQQPDNSKNDLEIVRQILAEGAKRNEVIDERLRRLTELQESSDILPAPPFGTAGAS